MNPRQAVAAPGATCGALFPANLAGPTLRWLPLYLAIGIELAWGLRGQFYLPALPIHAVVRLKPGSLLWGMLEFTWELSTASQAGG